MTTKRKINHIATEIYDSWVKVNPAAAPYLSAMKHLETIDDNFGCDSAADIVTRFLCNAQSWRGDDARRIKSELNALIK